MLIEEPTQQKNEKQQSIQENQQEPEAQNAKPDVFPFIPPLDSQLRYEPNLYSILDSSKAIYNSTKFCPVCDCPIIVSIVAIPCNHYMCYSCYCLSPDECQICQEIIHTFKRLEDTETYFTCEIDKCHGYFDSENKLKEHQKFHSQQQ